MSDRRQPRGHRANARVVDVATTAARAPRAQRVRRSRSSSRARLTASRRAPTPGAGASPRSLPRPPLVTSPRAGGAAVLLADGRVLLVRGLGRRRGRAWDGRRVRPGQRPLRRDGGGLLRPRAAPVALALPDGRDGADHLWRTDGTDAGTVLVPPSAPCTPPWPEASIGDRVYVSNNDWFSAPSLCVSGGAGRRVRLLAALR
jgi:hypothetical protein